jgi:hypothetical protein
MKELVEIIDLQRTQLEYLSGMVKCEDCKNCAALLISYKEIKNKCDRAMTKSIYYRSMEDKKVNNFHTV